MPKLFEFSVMKIDTDKRSVMKIDSDKRSKLKSQMSCQILKRKIIRMKSNTLNIFLKILHQKKFGSNHLLDPQLTVHMTQLYTQNMNNKMNFQQQQKQR